MGPSGSGKSTIRGACWLAQALFSGQQGHPRQRGGRSREGHRRPRPPPATAPADALQALCCSRKMTRSATSATACTRSPRRAAEPGRALLERPASHTSPRAGRASPSRRRPGASRSPASARPPAEAHSPRRARRSRRSISNT